MEAVGRLEGPQWDAARKEAVILLAGAHGCGLVESETEGGIEVEVFGRINFVADGYRSALRILLRGAKR